MANQFEWDFSCVDWLDRLKAGRSLLPALPLIERDAAKAIKIFNALHLPDVPGTPLLRDGAGEWLRDIVRAIFGSLVDGKRMVPELFALVPKKNSKTTGGAAVMLVALLMNERPRGEFLFVAPTHEIADIAFQQASGMIETDDQGYLQKRFHVQNHIKQITDRTNKATVKIKTFDMQVMTGTKPSGVLIDELHLMGNISYAARVIGQIRGGLLPNPEAFLIMITTQSDEPPAGVFRSELQYARAVRAGNIEGARTLPLLYEFSEQQQTDPAKPWRSPKYWPQVLPNLGKSIHIDRLIADFRTAVEKGDDEERRWASQHLNVEIGLALHADRWRGADYWLQAKRDGLTLDVILSRSDAITVGIDGGGLDDLLGLAVIGRDKNTREWMLWAHAWAQRDVLKMRKENAPKLLDFERDGDLTLCDDATQDIRELTEYVERCFTAGLVPEKNGIGLDPYAISAIVDALADKNIEGEMLTAIRQGSALSPASWGMERKLKDGTLVHGGQPLMTWCVGNARTEQRGNAVIITKETAGKAKIDPLIASFNAAMLMSRNPQGAAEYQMIVIN